MPASLAQSFFVNQNLSVLQESTPANPRAPPPPLSLTVRSNHEDYWTPKKKSCLRRQCHCARGHRFYHEALRCLKRSDLIEDTDKSSLGPWSSYSWTADGFKLLAFFKKRWIPKFLRKDFAELNGPRTWYTYDDDDDDNHEKCCLVAGKGGFLLFFLFFFLSPGLTNTRKDGEKDKR